MLPFVCSVMLSALKFGTSGSMPGAAMIELSTRMSMSPFEANRRTFISPLTSLMKIPFSTNALIQPGSV